MPRGWRWLRVPLLISLVFCLVGATVVVRTYVRQSTDCSAEVAQFPYLICYQLNPLAVFIGNDTSYGTGGGAATPTLDQVGQAGNSYDHATSRDTAMIVRRSPTSPGWRVWVDASGFPRLDCDAGDGTNCTQAITIYDDDPLTFLNQSGATLASITHAGAPTFAVGPIVTDATAGRGACFDSNKKLVPGTNLCDAGGAGGGGDITAVIAGAGISGGNTTGDATVTWAPDTFVNNMTLWDGANASRTITYNLSGTDVVETFSSGLKALTGSLSISGTTLLSGVATFTLAPVFQVPPTFGTTKPKRDKPISADSVRVTGCTDTDPVLRIPVTSGPKMPTIQPSDNDACSLEFDAWMPTAYDGGTVEVEVEAIAPLNANGDVLSMDIYGQCVPSGSPVAALGTTGERNAAITWGNNTALRQTAITGTPITLNGSPAGGCHAFFRAQINASATTTTAQAVTNNNITAFRILYRVTTTTE